MGQEKTWRSIGALNGFMATAMGAVAAHAIADPALAGLAEKASLYQLIHAVLLLWVSAQEGKCLKATRYILLAGVFLFCGSLYVKALTGWAAATTLAPLGGISLMAGWLLIALSPRKIL